MMGAIFFFENIFNPPQIGFLTIQDGFGSLIRCHGVCFGRFSFGKISSASSKIMYNGFDFLQISTIIKGPVEKRDQNN
jgi:hypothetical protein